MRMSLGLGLGMTNLSGGNSAPPPGIFQRAVNRASAQSRVAKIVVFGHSHPAGEGAGSGTLGLQGCTPLGFAGLLPAKLTAKGIAAENHSIFGDYNAVGSGSGVLATYLDTRLALGAGWQSDSAPFTFGGAFITGTPGGGTLDFTPGYTFTSVRFWYPTTTGLSTSVQVLVDGVVKTTLNQSTTDGYVFVDIVATGTKVSLKNTAGSGNVYFAGFECIRSGPVAKVLTGAWMGGKITDLNSSSFAFAPLPALTALAGDLGILYCMTNDINASVTAATWKTNAKAIIQQMLLTGEAILVIDPPGSTFNATLYQQYSDAAYQIQSETGCSILDLKALFVSYANSVTQGWQYDTAHPNATGYNKIADALITL